MDEPKQVLCLAPDSRAVARLRKAFILLPDGGEARRVLAQGVRAEQALRVALSAPGSIDLIVLLSPPPVEMLGREVTERLRDLDCVVLALFGTEDEISPPTLGHGWRRALAKCFVMFVYDAGPDMANERPEAVATLIEDFFRRGENFLVRIADDRRYP